MLTLSPSLKLVINRTLPLTLGMFAIMLVQLVDSVFIGLLGMNELAVHGVTIPFQTVMIGIQVGIGVAATAIISRALGAGQLAKARSTATLSVLFGIASVTLVSLLLWLLGEPILTSFISTEGNPQHLSELRAIFHYYWPVWLFSAVTVAALYLISCVYRANEDNRTTGRAFLAASIINLILDPILIFSLDMGIIGAAIASSIAYACCAAYMLFRARDKKWFNPVSTFCVRYFSELARMTIPTTANQVLPSISAVVSMMFIAKLGTDAVAFWGLLSRIEGFLLVFTLALTMSIPPIVGRYLGARELDKISALLITTAKFLLIFHVVVALCLTMVTDGLIALISNEIQLRTWLETALWIIPFSYGPLGLCMVVVSVFNALGVPKKALLLSFLRLFVLYIPAIIIGTVSGSIRNTLIAATLANVLTGIFAWFMLKRYLHIIAPREPQFNYAQTE